MDDKIKNILKKEEVEKDVVVVDLIEEDLWDHYSGLPNPMWYDKKDNTNE